MRSSRRAALALLAAASLVGTALSTQALGAGRPRSAAPDPVVFVHGWNSSAAKWDTMVQRFTEDGWPTGHLDQWDYDSHQSNVTTASRLAQEVDRVLAATGAARVDLVTHSMGAFPARYYARNLGGDSRIDAWVSLGGPNHGTGLANFCGDVSCEEMRPGSAFLSALNSGDETPGAPRYGTWRSPCDFVVVPQDSVALAGATNTTTACVGHSELRTDPAVYHQVKSFVS